MDRSVLLAASAVLGLVIGALYPLL